MRALAPVALFVVLSGLALAEPAAKQQLSDQQIAEIIVGESRQAYYRTGHPCACPEDWEPMRQTERVSRPGGAQPYCYLSDVPAAEIARYRTTH